MKKSVMTKNEYYELIKQGGRGHYPRVLTTPDGLIFRQEFKDNYDQWKPDGVVLCTVRSSDDWPTYGYATARRREIRKEYFSTP